MMAWCRSDEIDLILLLPRLLAFLLPLSAHCPIYHCNLERPHWEMDLVASSSVVLLMSFVVAEMGAVGMRNSAALDLD